MCQFSHVLRKYKKQTKENLALTKPEHSRVWNHPIQGQKPFIDKINFYFAIPNNYGSNNGSNNLKRNDDFSYSVIQ